MALKTTYNDILEKMKSTFFEVTGQRVENMSDIGARFQAVASELLSVSCYGDFILKQAFPQTATGEYLDYHAEIRGTSRKGAAKAHGKLKFYISEPASEDISIETGVICSVENKPFVQFETTQRATIKAGDVSAEVDAVAIDFGEEYNVGENMVTVMVNPPIGVLGVTNDKKFVGGLHTEDDEKLRKRIIELYSVAPTGITYESLAEQIMTIDGVIDCRVYTPTSSVISVCLRTTSGELDDEIIAQIPNKLMIAIITSTNIGYSLAEPEEFNLNIKFRGDTDVSDKIIEECRAYTRALRIGESLDLNELAYKFRGLDGIEYVDIISDKMAGDSVFCLGESYLVLNDCVVTMV